MSQEYTPVTWTDETESTPGTVIDKARLDQMQRAHHYADGLREVDTIPTEDPGVDYHMIVYCTADTTLYRWDGTQWTKDIDDPTRELLDREIARATAAEQGIAGDLSAETTRAQAAEQANAQAIGIAQGDIDAHEARTDNPHAVTKAQVGLGNADNTSDIDKPVSTAQQAALDAVDAGALHKAGAETVTGEKTILANINIGATGNPKNVTQVGGINLTGDITVQGNITQNGSQFITHAEQIETSNDYIKMRDGATGALSPGSYSGFEIEKYNGTDNGRLVIDSTGTARVGDVGNEQPLLTREEESDLTDGQLLKWDAANSKAVGQTIDTAPTAGSSAPVTSGGVKDALDAINIVLTNQSAAFSLQSTPDDSAFPYRATITDSRITADTYAHVVLSSAQAKSGSYSPTCETAAGVLYLYASAAVGTVTIPTILLVTN